MRGCAPLAPALSPLERRLLFAVAPAPSSSLQTDPTVHVVIDYSLDSNNFFDTQSKRDLLQQAADLVALWFRDDLLAITPGGGDSWDAVLDHPATGLSHSIPNRTIAANEVLLFAGGRDMTDALGRGGPGGFQSRGSPTWSDRIRYRGQSQSGQEFGPWGGAITFDTNPSSPWHFGTTTSGLGGANDFLSVAAHEVAHLFGFGTSDPWNGLTNGARFTGPVSTTLYDGTGNPTLASDDAHWSDGLRDEGQEVAMDPQITVGTRRLPTPLDFAALDDIGWSMPPRSAPTLTAITQPATAGHEVVVTWSHYADMDATTFQQPGDVYAVAPGGAVVPATYSRMATNTDGTIADVTYVLSPPGGAWDSSDNGTWSLVLENNSVLSTTGEEVAGGTLGTFAVDIADAPVGVLQPVANPTPGPGALTIVVVYSDAIAVDPASFDVNDIEVTDPEGAPMSVLSAAADSATPGTPRIATYTLAPRGGAWGPEDDGEYTVRLRADEVRDTSGNVSADAVVGAFELTLGVLTFEARRPAVYTDASGDLVKVMLKGPGTGRLRFDANRPADPIALELDGTTAASSLTIKAAGGGTPIGNVIISGSLKSIIGKAADLTGDMLISGSVRQVRLRNASGGHSLIIEDGGITSLAFGEVDDLSVQSGSDIRSIRASNWRNTDFITATVSAPFIGSIKAGQWTPNVETRVLLSLRATRLDSNFVIADDAIGTINAATISGSRIFAGVRDPHLGRLPDSLDDFANPSATIRSVVARTFDASFVAAPTIGKLSLGIATGGSGVSADRVASFTARPSAFEPPTKLRNVEQLANPLLAGIDIQVL